jgi:ABC-type dipeptide/oligopeptide/nickel transport system permease subunit
MMKGFSLIGRACLLGILLLIGIALFAPLLAPHDPMDTDPGRRLSRPPGYILGCDDAGQCVFSRLIHGTRLSLLIGFLARSFAVLIGVGVGLASGYYGGWVDWLLMRVVDIFLAFPSLLLAIAISVAFGNGLKTVVFAIAIVGWAETARIVRGAVLELRSAEFVLAAKALGAGDLRVMLRHILPNCFPLIVVIFTMGMATAILAEASLSFLGLGADPQLPTWGGMVSNGKDYLLMNPGLSLYPGFCIALVVILFNVTGDELRDLLDPGRKEQWGR